MGRPKLKVEANKEHLKLYRTKSEDMVNICGHVEVENQTLAKMRSTCQLCLHKYENSNEVKDWLKCPTVYSGSTKHVLDFKIVAV